MSMPRRRISRANAVALRRIRSGFFEASGRVRWVAPDRTMSCSNGPPPEATYEVHPATTNAPASSTVPRSAPPETKRGTICSTAGGRPLSGAGTVLSSTPMPLAAISPMSPFVIVPRRDGATIAYRRLAGRNPGVVFLGGFRSDMTGTKASFLEEYCRRCGRAYLRFDYFGHGASSGDVALGTIGRWAEDAVAVIDAL